MDDLLEVLNSGAYVSRRKPLPPLRPRFDEEVPAKCPLDLQESAESADRGAPQGLLTTQRNFFPNRTNSEQLAGRELSVGGPEREESLEKLHKVKTSQGGRRLFNIRKVSHQPKPQHAPSRELVNLVPEITPDINKRVDYRPNLAENRLAGSKHMLFKTFTRYLANPAQFQQQTAINDLVDLNANFTDASLTSKLFRGGPHEKQVLQ